MPEGYLSVSLCRMPEGFRSEAECRLPEGFRSGAECRLPEGFRSPRPAVLRCFASHSSGAFRAQSAPHYSPLFAWGRGYAPDGAAKLLVQGR